MYVVVGIIWEVLYNLYYRMHSRDTLYTAELEPSLSMYVYVRSTLCCHAICARNSSSQVGLSTKTSFLTELIIKKLVFSFLTMES